ncbi:MAG TPA: chlorite dismutase family protein [Candidatus Polarisedimenticolia bacterium]|nr:chlorite dismutase family protein [Candidatus Polarisedimenticolia bacterium]
MGAAEGTHPPSPAAAGSGREKEHQPAPPDLAEKGAPIDGVPQVLDTRLFMQLQVFTGCFESAPVIKVVRESGLEAVVYANVNDPRGVGVLLISESPALFALEGRELLTRGPFASLTPLPEFTMMGRTYSTGRETDLSDWLLLKARRTALNTRYPWAVWYPLRRIGAFNRLSRDEQGKIMLEHAVIGRAYGEAGHAFDIRLECHGLDRDDNEFVLGIVGPELYPLSRLIKDMRRTRQTSEFMEKMGPFFVGRAVYQSPAPSGQERPAY